MADAVCLTAVAAQARSATWTHTPAETGDYRVFARWPEAAEHATDTQYTIEHSAGSTVVTVSEAQRGG